MFRPTPFYLSLLFIITFTLTPKTECLQSNQHQDSATDSTLEAFCMPIRFSRTGIQYFIRTIFNNPLYGREYLPHNFSHLIQFLYEGKKNKQTRNYMEATLRLFMNKLKSSRYVSAYSFNDALRLLPGALEEYCVVCPEESYLSSASKVIKDTLYNFFSNKFSFFKEEPDAFFQDMTSEITSQLGTGVRNHVECEELRQTLIRFLEIGLMKIVWSPVDQMEVWDSVKSISKELSTLHDKDIINQDELDDLYKSLLESFCHFLDLAGSELSLETVNKIKEDITQGNLHLFELQEQEELLETKGQRIQSALMETEAKVRARLQGIITEQVVIC